MSDQPGTPLLSWICTLACVAWVVGVSVGLYSTPLVSTVLVTAGVCFEPPHRMLHSRALGVPGRRAAWYCSAAWGLQRCLQARAGAPSITRDARAPPLIPQGARLCIRVCGVLCACTAGPGHAGRDHGHAVRATLSACCPDPLHRPQRGYLERAGEHPCDRRD